MELLYGSKFPTTDWDKVNIGSLLAIYMPPDWELQERVDSAEIIILSPRESLADTYRENVAIYIHDKGNSTSETMLKDFEQLITELIPNLEILETQKRIYLPIGFETDLIVYKSDLHVNQNFSKITTKIKSYIIMHPIDEIVFILQTNSTESGYDRFQPIFDKIVNSLTKYQAKENEEEKGDYFEEDEISNDYEIYFKSEEVALFREDGVIYFKKNYGKQLPLSNVKSVFAMNKFEFRSLFGLGVILLIGYFVFNFSSILGLIVVGIGLWMGKMAYDDKEKQIIKVSHFEGDEIEYFELPNKDIAIKFLNIFNEIAPKLQIIAPDLKIFSYQ